jgi:DNA polymerase III subunit epsilon
MKVVIFDSETSGFIDNHVVKLKDQPFVIELYACKSDLDTGEILKELDMLVKPPIEITPKITEITGITNEMVLDAKTFLEISDEVREFIENGEMIIAHNLSYDKEMIDIEFERLGQKINWPKLCCTVEQTAWVKGYRLNLGALHEFLFGEKFEGAHRAKTDVMALLRCCVELRKRNWI